MFQRDLGLQSLETNGPTELVPNQQPKTFTVDLDRFTSDSLVTKCCSKEILCGPAFFKMYLEVLGC